MSGELVGARREVFRNLPAAALLASALAWIGLLLARTTDVGSGFYESSMAVGGTATSALLFLGVWEVMVVAMMLPSSIGFLALFRVVTRGTCSPFVRGVTVCIGYVLVWAGVGCMAVIVVVLDRTEHIDIWLAGHANILAGGVLVLAGGFQFTALKRRCLLVCSQPGMFLMRHYRRGAGNAFMLGLRFGLVCLGCCWALMTLMVVLGGGSIYLMLLLTVIMFAERTLGWDDRFVRVVGLLGVALGVLIVASPEAVPALAQNAERWADMQSMQFSPHGLLLWCHA
jgi:predicted metal-binding membrane protein